METARKMKMSKLVSEEGALEGVEFAAVSSAPLVTDSVSELSLSLILLLLFSSSALPKSFFVNNPDLSASARISEAVFVIFCSINKSGYQ